MKQGTLLVVIITLLYITSAYMFSSWAANFNSSTIPTTLESGATNQELNFTVNNTDSTYNITQVNITIPSGFAFITDSNSTTASNTLFSNDSTNITWDNTTIIGFIENGTEQYFLFNVSVPTGTGDYNFTISTLDTGGVPNSTNVTITVSDTTYPSDMATVSPTLSNNSATSLDWFYVNVTFIELNPDTCLLDIDNGTAANYTMTMIGSYACYFNATGQGEGDWNYSVWVNDSSDNWGWNGTWFITVDTTPPTFSSHARSPDPPNEDENVMLNMTVTEDSLDTVLLDWNHSTNYTVTTSSGSEYYFTILSGNYTAHDQLNYTWYANDTSGNLNASYGQTFTVANQQPSQPTLTAPSDYANISTTNVTFQFSSTDQDDEDILTYYIFINNTLNDSTTSTYIDINFSDGYYNWSVQADDSYQNSTISSTRFFTIDATAPSTDFIPPTDTNGTEAENKDYITWNVSVTENVSSCSIEINTTNQTATIVNATTDSYCYFNETGLSGNVTRCAIAHSADVFGNWNTTQTTICRSTNEQQDIYPPVLDFTAPTPSNNTHTQNESWVYFNVSANEQLSTCFLDNGTSNLTMPVTYDYCQYNLTDQTNGTEVYRWVWANDTSGNWNRTDDLNVTINLTSDVTPPYWSNNQTNIVTTYSPVQLSYFNITWQDAATGMHTVYIETNLSGSDYNHSMYTGGSGVYQFNYSIPAGDFYWRSWANDTSGNLNFSDTWYFTVAKASNPLQLYLNGSQDNISITYQEMSNASAYVTAGSVDLYRNETPVANPELDVLHAGEHIYKANTSGNQNYTANETALNVTVDKRTTGIYLDLTPSSPITYGTSTTVTCQANSTEVSHQLYRNDSDVDSENATQVSLPAGYWEYKCNCSETQNYTSASNMSYYQVNRASMTLHLYLNGSEDNMTADFGNTTNATGTKDQAEGSLDILLNGSSLGASQHITNLGAGYWNYTLVFAQTQNYSANSTTLFVTINQVSSSTSLYLNGSADDQTYDYEETTNSTAYCDYGSLTFHINSTTIASPFEQNLGAGYWNFTAYCPGDSNHTASQNTSHATVNKIPSATTLYLNGSQGNLTQTYPESINVSAYCDYGSLTLYMNSTPAASPYEETLTAGYTYNFTAYCPGDSNHTATEKTFFADVNKASILITLLINGSAGNLDQTYPDSVNVSAYTNTTSATLHINSTAITSPYEETLTAGYTYNFTAFELDDQNHTGDSETFYVDVSKGDPHLTLLLNGTDNNAAMNEDTTLNITVYLDVSETVDVYVNSSLYDSGNAPLENLSAIADPGALNISAYYSGSQNYTINSSTHWLTVNDTTPPDTDFISPTDTNGTEPANKDYIAWNVSVTENIAACYIEINGTNQTSTTIVNASTNSYCYYNETSLSGNVTRCSIAHATDAHGNWNTTPEYICRSTNEQQDIYPPVLDFTAPTPSNNSYTQNENWVYFNVSSNEQLSACLLDNSTTNLTMTLGSGSTYCYHNLTNQPNQTQVYRWVWANDTSGNLNRTADLNVTINLTGAIPPSITVDSPLNQSYNSTTLDLNITTSKSADYCWYNLNSTTNQSMSGSGTDWDAIINTGGEGLFNLFVYCNDSASSEGVNDTIWFTVDTTPSNILNVNNGTVTFSTAYILWNTDEPATSKVYYSTNQSDLSSSKTNSTLVTNHNITLPNLTGSSTYYYNVSSCDSAGNCNTSATYNFTTPQCVESWSCGEWSECSGSIQSRTCTDANSCGTSNNKPDEAQECEEDDGGGGGGGGVYIPPVPQPYVSHSWEKITPENVSIMKLNEREIGIHEIGISVTNEANDVYIKVTKLDSKPASVVHNVSGKAYQYIEVYKRNLEEDNIEEAIIRFNVNKTWINENNIDKNSIGLNSYINGWVKLPTQWVTENSEVVFYEAESSGLSVFAITGQEIEFLATACGNGVCETGENSANCPGDCPPEKPEQPCTPDSMRCMGTFLQQCSSDGLLWETLENCQYGCSEERCLERAVGFIDFINNIDYTLVALVAIMVISIPLGGILIRRKSKKTKAYCIKCKKTVTMKKEKTVTMKNGKRAKKGICPRCGSTVFKLGLKESKEKEEPSRTEAYCIKCKKTIRMKNEQIVTMKNGRQAKKGTCPNCGTNVFRLCIGKDTATKVSEEKLPKTEAYCFGCKKKVFMKDEQTVIMKNGRKAKKGTCPDCGKTVFRIGIK